MVNVKQSKNKQEDLGKFKLMIQSFQNTVMLVVAAVLVAVVLMLVVVVVVVMMKMARQPAGGA